MDQFDKAPLEVVSILKGIVEDGEMLLADGRKLVSQQRFDALTNNNNNNNNNNNTNGGSNANGNGGQKLVPIHPGFSIVALANRPGWPFQVS